MRAVVDVDLCATGRGVPPRVAAGGARAEPPPTRLGLTLRAVGLTGAALLVLVAAARAESAEDFDALLAGATALNREMAARTNGNLPLVDGLQDTDEHKAMWAELAPRALDQARRAEALRPDSAAAAAAVANAYMFYASSLGIVKSILQGASGEYREHARRLIELDPAYDDGLGDYLLASFYLVAPWPLRDREAALRHYRRAEELSPHSVRNHYGLAVYWARVGDLARSRRHFEQVIALPCTAHGESLFCDWMKQEAQRALADDSARSREMRASAAACSEHTSLRA